MRGTAAQVSEARRAAPGPARARSARSASPRPSPALCPLQPVRREPAGLVCAPRSAPEAAAAGARVVPLPRPPAGRGARLARPARGDDRAAGTGAAPATWRPRRACASWSRPPARASGRATTPRPRCASRRSRRCPPGPALDAGCGSGLLAQAWAALGRGPVLAVDVDPRAVDQAAAQPRGRRAGGSGRGAPGAARGACARRPRRAGRCSPTSPPGPTRALLARVAGPPARGRPVGHPARRGGGPRDAWEALGLRPDGAWERGGFAACGWWAR